MDKTKIHKISNKDAFIKRMEGFGKGDLGREIMDDQFILTDWYFELCGITSIRTGQHVVVYRSMIEAIDEPVDEEALLRAMRALLE